MPLAFDLTSTLDNGSTLPVATTDLAMEPCSTFASFSEGMVLSTAKSAPKTQYPPNTTRSPTTERNEIVNTLFLAMRLPPSLYTQNRSNKFDTLRLPSIRGDPVK